MNETDAFRAGTCHAGITFTGVDAWTNPFTLHRLSEQHEDVEFAVLLTHDPEGRPRYPDVDFVRKTVEWLGPRCAVHVCGRRARENALAGTFEWLRYAGRVQLNGAVSADELRAALGLWERVIVPQAPGLPDWSELPLDGCPPGSLQLLMDASRGQGIRPERWTRPFAAYHPAGSAGGLGPHNLREELPRIHACHRARNDWWVDMETGVRDDRDRFDLGKVEACTRIWREYWDTPVDLRERMMQRA